MKFSRRKDDTSRATYSTTSNQPPAGVSFAADLVSLGTNGQIVLREITSGADAWRQSMRPLELLKGAGDLAAHLQPEDGGKIALSVILEDVASNGRVVLREVEGGAKRTKATRQLQAHKTDSFFVTLRRALP